MIAAINAAWRPVADYARLRPCWTRDPATGAWTSGPWTIDLVTGGLCIDPDFAWSGYRLSCAGVPVGPLHCWLLDAMRAAERAGPR